MKKILPFVALLLWPSIASADTTDAETDTTIYDKILFLNGNLGTQHAKVISKWMSASIKNNNIPVNFILSIAYFESAFNQGAQGVQGEKGIMQIMPFWAKRELCKGLRLWHGKDNVECGCRIYKFYTDMFEGNHIYGVAAYNMGEARIRWFYNHRRNQVVKFWYVKEVLKIKKRLDEFDKK